MNHGDQGYTFAHRAQTDKGVLRSRFSTTLVAIMLHPIYRSIPIAIAACVTLAFASSAASSNDGRADTESFLTDRAEVNEVALPVRLTKGQKVYRFSVWAVSVERIVCDSKHLSESGTEEVGCKPDLSEIEPNADLWLYQVSAKRLVFAKPQEPPFSTVVLAYYDIPENWQDLEIVYRIKSPEVWFPTHKR